ncbi:Eco57I restriction-modification methylase domain-containing protein [Hydrogenophaga sp. MI9]|uniref:Eco57I restriction-modification methylase domain-containing protein n=1 Tax=Hydrogenophaga sp. MI9 TaxID=3453719 RepID=UPI003EEA5063
MAQLNFLAFEEHLKAFDFQRLFVDVLGWNRPAAGRDWQADHAGDTAYSHRTVAELGGVVALQVVVDGGWPDEAQRLKVWKHVAHSHAENLLIFTNQQTNASQSQWYWVKRDKHPETGKPRLTSRRHDYFKGQPVDLFASKLQAMVVELSELDTAGRLPVLEAARRIQAALDVDKTTKKFFTAYQQQHLELLSHIQGIDNERDKRWYASVLLNRLMFVWFMQKKFFLDGGNADYLRTKLAESQQRGANRFFGEFLKALFFEAFAKPAADRSVDAKALTGQIPYLNGGLFLPHKLELDEQHAIRVGRTLRVADAAFEGIFKLFADFSWHLDDTPRGEADEINPDVLGYIFEKYINQKAFGAYYTRPEITSYLAERSIHQLILERIHEPAMPELGLKEVKFDSVPDLLAKMDARTALRLVNQVLPSITILDPAVGSGAFLVAALKCLINVYYAVVGRAEMGASSELKNWLALIQQDHPSVGYYIKRRIVTDNLYGVDIMEEACEIAKLRLFLSMVSSVRQVEHLEPLPNIDFNILPGNSLVGLMRVDEHEFDAKYRQGDMFRKSFRELVDEKNRRLDNYRHAADAVGRDTDLRALRDDIDTALQEANQVLNELVHDRFSELNIKYEEATWDAVARDLGKPKKRAVKREDIEAQAPFHWGYVFDDIMQRRGGFDVILANPPWEGFKPQAKEYFAPFSEKISKKNMSIKEFEVEQARLLQYEDIRAGWLAYQSRFPHMSAYFRSAADYQYQSAVVGGKRTGSDINLYKLFTERCFALLRDGGHCGIVIPNGIYKDLGATGLRNMLFDHAQVDSIIALANERFIFEEVDHRVCFAFLTFEKGGNTQSLRATFRINPREAIAADDFTSFVENADNFIELSAAMIGAMNAETRSVLEFRSAADVSIVDKMLAFPALGEKREGVWNLKLTNEFHMTNDSKLFHTEPADGRLPLYEGRMIHQFTSDQAPPKYWIEETEGRASILGTKAKTAPTEKLGYESARFAFREIARSTDARTMIASMLPPRVFANHKLMVGRPESMSGPVALYVLGIVNSVTFDYLIRQQVASSISMYAFYQMPVPRLMETDLKLKAISARAARLVCTSPPFDELARQCGLESHREGAHDPSGRARLRAELDGLVAHLFGLNEEELAHIFKSFPLVPEPAKVAALNAWRDVKKGLIS